MHSLDTRPHAHRDDPESTAAAEHHLRALATDLATAACTGAALTHALRSQVGHDALDLVLHANRAAQEGALGARARARDGMREAVRGLARAGVLPERVLTLVRGALQRVVRSPECALGRDARVSLEGEIIQWAIADYFGEA